MHILVQASACGTVVLRAVNLLFGAACLPLFYFMHQQLHADATTTASLATVCSCLSHTAPVMSVSTVSRSRLEPLHPGRAQMHALLLPV